MTPARHIQVLKTQTIKADLNYGGSRRERAGVELRVTQRPDCKPHDIAGWLGDPGVLAPRLGCSPFGETTLGKNRTVLFTQGWRPCFMDTCGMGPKTGTGSACVCPSLPVPRGLDGA